MNPDAEIFYPEYLKRDLARKKFSSSPTVLYEGNGEFPNCLVCKEVHNLDTNWFEYLERSVADHEVIMSSNKYNFEEKIEKKAILGPFHVNPFSHDIVISPLNSVPKRFSGTEDHLGFKCKRRGCYQRLYRQRQLFRNEVHLKYPNVDALVELIKKHGRNCLIFKRDLSRAYRQIFIDLHDVHLVGYKWNDHLYFDRVLSMGLRSAAHICQRVTNAVAFMFRQMGFDIVNYLDDFCGVESVDRADKAYIELKRLLDSCGLEESFHKAVYPSTRMEFLGIICDTSKLLLQNS
ncbi:unnamed protein product [Mytilus coruscus]|uniref:Reverse transcriptase domain-containing protein n=1 Tax=Mytilus coruscus TaxID=42192 RepID=A0A6J8CNQ7_MYTCO|nr:unnamed protein product [Mytilus coruscus]